jgi:hypothetical protein
MRSLHHVASAIRHAEHLADEAEDLAMTDLSARLRTLGAIVALDLERAVRILEDVEPARDARALAHQSLSSVYGEATLRLETSLPRGEVSRLSPGGHLDVVERVRYRLRRLETRDDEDQVLIDVRTDLERALFAYDTTIDAYLLACAEAQATKDAVVVESQALRLELERAKHRLLAKAEAGSEAWKRIKRRPVRTKRARFIDDAAVQKFLAAAPRAA